jgi:hypothetical protein
VAGIPQHNGRAERFNPTITERVRALLNSSGVAKKYWAEAFSAAVDIYNVSPRMGAIETPYQLFFGVKPDVRSFRTFGCEVYCRKQRAALTKLGERSERGLVMGREPGTKGWRVLLENGSVVVRYNCVFVENVEDDDDSDDDEDIDRVVDGSSAVSAALASSPP